MSNKIEINFKIDIDSIHKDEEGKLQKKIAEIKEPSLSYTEKRIMCLSDEKTITDTIDKKVIDIKEIKDEWNNNIEEKIKEIKDPYLTDEQKRFIVLKQEKTTTYIIDKEKDDHKDDHKDNNYLSEDSISYLTDRDSILDKIELDDSYSDVSINNNKKKVDVETIKDEYEYNIQEKMKKYNDTDLNEFEKRLLVIKEDETTTLKKKNFYKFENIDIQGINKENDNNFKEKINKKNEPYIREYEKKKQQLKEDKTSTELSYTNDSTKSSFNISNNLTQSRTKDSTSINNNLSTIFEGNSQIFPSSNTSEDKIIPDNLIVDTSQEQDTYKFNKAKINHYLKNKLSDILLNPTNNCIKCPRKYIINETCYFLIYPNDLNTYYISISNVIGNYINNNQDSINIEKYYSIYNESLGLFFCGKTIEIKGKIEQELKKCEPNSFICKECMQLNKAKYKIKNNFLINIKGRIAKVSKGSYHCFGHYSCNKQIEDCISKFTCLACTMLNKYSNYYV